MSFARKVKRNKLRKKWKENNRGVEKKYRTNFADFWKEFKER